MKNLKLMLTLVAVLVTNSGLNSKLYGMTGGGYGESSSSVSNTGIEGQDYDLHGTAQEPYSARYYMLDMGILPNYAEYRDLQNGGQLETTSDKFAQAVSMINSIVTRHPVSPRFTDPDLIKSCQTIATIIEHLNGVAFEHLNKVARKERSPVPGQAGLMLYAFLRYVAQTTLAIIQRGHWQAELGLTEEWANNIIRLVKEAEEAVVGSSSGAQPSQTSAARSGSYTDVAESTGAACISFATDLDNAQMVTQLDNLTRLARTVGTDEFNGDVVNEDFFEKVNALRKNITDRLELMERTLFPKYRNSGRVIPMDILDHMINTINSERARSEKIESLKQLVTTFLQDAQVGSFARLSQQLFDAPPTIMLLQNLADLCEADARLDQFKSDLDKVFFMRLNSLIRAQVFEKALSVINKPELHLISSAQAWPEIIDILCYCIRLDSAGNSDLKRALFANTLEDLSKMSARQDLNFRSAVLAITLLSAGYPANIDSDCLQWATATAIGLPEGELRTLLLTLLENVILSRPFDMGAGWAPDAPSELYGFNEPGRLRSFAEGFNESRAPALINCRVFNSNISVNRGDSAVDTPDFQFFRVICALQDLVIASEEAKAGLDDALAAYEEQKAERAAELLRQQEQWLTQQQIAVRRAQEERDRAQRVYEVEQEEIQAAQRIRVEQQEREEQLAREVFEQEQEELREAQRRAIEEREGAERNMMGQEDDAGHKLRNAEDAATKIQENWRKHQARVDGKKMRDAMKAEQDAAARTIQRAERGRQARALANAMKKEREDGRLAAEQRRQEALANAKVTLNAGLNDIFSQLDAFGAAVGDELGKVNKKISSYETNIGKLAQHKRRLAEEQRRQAEQDRIEREEQARLAELQRRQAEEEAARIAAATSVTTPAPATKLETAAEKRARLLEERQRRAAASAGSSSAAPVDADALRRQLEEQRLEAAARAEQARNEAAALENAKKKQAVDALVTSFRSGGQLDRTQLATVIPSILQELPSFPTNFTERQAYFGGNAEVIDQAKVGFNRAVDNLSRLGASDLANVIPSTITPAFEEELETHGFKFSALRSMMRQ